MKTNRRYSLRMGDMLWLHVDGRTFRVPMNENEKEAEVKSDESTSGLLKAPMPALVRLVQCAKNDRVQAGQLLLVLEAMKMEYQLKAPFDGKIAKVACRADQQVKRGELLVEVVHES